MQPIFTLHQLTLENAHLLMGADVFDHPVDPAQLSAFVENTHHELIFAISETKVVGLASGAILLHPDKPPIFFVNEVGVDANMRSKGIATALLQKLLDVARRRGCQGIWLATEVDNDEARGLYRKLKARETEGFVIYDWDGAMDR